MSNLTGIPNPSSSFVLTKDSKARMRKALERNSIISQKQYESNMGRLEYILNKKK